MGGLGNGRRGGRSPPLLIAALIACILVLGFNYWMSSSRNLELQTKLYELDGKVRRGAAEQEVAEMRRTQYQEEIQRQKEQMGHIESLYKMQLEGAQSTCSQERVFLQQNISSSTRAIQDLKGQLNQLSDDLGKLQKELQSCHGNINTLNNKLTYDMTHCNSQVLAQKELCDERVAAAKMNIQKQFEKLILPTGVQENPAKINVETEPPEVAASDSVKVSTPDHKPQLELKVQESSDALANEIIVAKETNSPVDLDTAIEHTVIETHSVPTTSAPKREFLPPPEEDGGKEGNEVDEVIEVEEEDEDDDGKAALMKNLTEMGNHEEQTDDGELQGMQGMQGMLLNEEKKEQKPVDHLLDEPGDYDADDQVVAEADSVKQHSKNIDKGMEKELADYNGDDENEGEFEADKQAELAQL